jgi:chromate transporter
MIHFLLFAEFFKTGLFSVGGGLATIPFIYDISDRYGWITHAQIADMIAVAESTPGPIGINVATYTGFHVAGLAGSAVATFAFVLPSVLIVSLVSIFMMRFRENRQVQAVFEALSPAATGLIAAVALNIVQFSLYNKAHSGFRDFLQMNHAFASLARCRQDW